MDTEIASNHLASQNVSLQKLALHQNWKRFNFCNAL